MKIQNNMISVIVPVYNMGEEITGFLQSVQASMQNTGRHYELIAVDDGSTDSTFEHLKQFAKGHPDIVLLRMRSTFGEAAALDAGIRHSSGKTIALLTARVRVNPAGLPEMLNEFDKGQDMVVGWRFPRRDSMMNRIISRLFNRMSTGMSKIQLHDINSGIFVTDRDVLGKINFYGDLHYFIPVLAARQGYSISEIKIEQLPGKFRSSRYPKEYLQRILDIITVLFLSRYSKKPIHFMGFAGGLFALLGMAVLIYLFFYRILLFGPIAGRPLLILGALLLVIGIQMISIGLLGEMVIFTHAGDIEEYNIEEIIN